MNLQPLESTSPAASSRIIFPFSSDSSGVVDVTVRNVVAIIMRTKDRPILLARAFASVLGQTHRHWRLYVVNDGGERAPVDRLVEEHAPVFEGRITVIHNESSLGMEAASNCAFDVMSGEFVVVHDDDDAWHPNFLEKTTRFLNALENRHYVAVLTNCTIVREKIEGDRVVELGRENWGYWRPFVDGAQLLVENVSPPICLLIRLSIARKIGHFNAHLPVLGDWDYLLRLFVEGDIGTIPEQLAYYHQRAKAAKSQYDNSVVADLDHHMLYQARYRNATIRRTLQSDPASLGLLHTLLWSTTQQHRQLKDVAQLQHDRVLHSLDEANARLERLERRVKKIGFSGLLVRLRKARKSVSRKLFRRKPKR